MSIRHTSYSALHAEGISLMRLHEVYLPLTMLGMVEAGFGIAVMSTAVNRLAIALGLVTRKLVNAVIKRVVSQPFHADRSLSPTAQRFRELLVRNKRQLVQE